MPRKPDADEIIEYMQKLPSELGLDARRCHWPKWLYRSDHVENAAAILNSGRLLSRAAASDENRIRVDSGSPQHVGQLSEQHRSLVRLYFRPRTPTQYANEGIRPQSSIQYNAHMPVPVYLLFASTLLAEQGISFTKSRLGEGVDAGDSAEFLKSIDFRDVYHDHAVGRLGESERRPAILNARHSEVVVENELRLDELKHIVCRSAPERETLLNLLAPESRQQWIKRIHVDTGERRMFYRRGTFVQRAILSTTEFRFMFYSNIASEMRGPFSLKIERSVEDLTTSAQKENFVIPREWLFCRINQPLSKYRVSVLLDGNLAYLGDFNAQCESELLV